MVEEEPEQEIIRVPLSQPKEDVVEPELPYSFLQQDDLDVLQESANILEAMGRGIACEGMTIALARTLETYEPSFIRRSGGLGAFTSTPSLEGLQEAVTTVKEKLSAVLKRLRQFVSDMYKRFVAWLTARFAKPENQAFKQELEAFLAERRNRDAIKFISELPDDVEQAAHDIAILMDGETKAFESTFIDQIQGTLKRAANIEKMLGENPEHYYLATGVVTVEELYKQDGASIILRKASATADRAMKATNAGEFMRVLEDVTHVTEALDAFESGMLVKDKESSQDNASDVPLIKLYENIQRVGEDMKRVNIQHLVEDMVHTVKNIIQISDETKVEDILEMIPQDVPIESQNAYAQKISLMYRKMAALGTKVLRLWKVRADSIASINLVGDALIGLVDGFEKAIVSSGTSLTDEQKTQLAKTLAGKGLKIIF